MIRLLYCYPDFMTEELMDTIAQEPKIVKYVDLRFSIAAGRCSYHAPLWGPRNAHGADREDARAESPAWSCAPP
ncbi:MAG: hypothetical protein ACLVDB_04955 [Anaeromassilibacillus sp.]